MARLTKIEKIKKNIHNNKELMKRIKNETAYFTTEQRINSFISDAQRYIEATKKGTMICIIDSVSKSGMSRTMRFLHCAKWKDQKRASYLNFFFLFSLLGYTPSRDKDCFRVSGCGMNMVFAVHSDIISSLQTLGFLTRKECAKLEQDYPTTL